MATGRTTSRWWRFYMAGYDLSGYTRKIGPLKQEYEYGSAAAQTDACMNAVLSRAALSCGELNGFFDNTATSGLHAVASGAGVKRVVMIPIGIRAAPAQGDQCFVGEFPQLSYKAVEEANYIVANIAFGNSDDEAAANAYTKPWGVLLHASGAETGVNTAIGVDDYGASPPSLGGYLCYQIFSVVGTGNVTIKVQEADTNVDGSFGDLSGATSGAIAHTAIPAAGIVALGTTAAIKRYLRWQISLVTITSVTFALAFVRSLG